MNTEDNLADGQRDMLVRLDERTRALITTMAELKTTVEKSTMDMRAALREHATEDDMRFDKTKIDDQTLSGRIGSLENWKTYILGGMALGGTLIVFLMWAVATFWRAEGTIVERKVTETQTIQRPGDKPKESKE